MDLLKLSVDSFGRLVLTDADGEHHVGVEPVRAFPLSHPDRFFALVNDRGREVFTIDDPSTLPPEVRSVLEAELRKREFVPVLRRVLWTSAESPPAEWEVETDRGLTRFTIDADDQIRRLGAGRVLITDTRGLRYLVPDTSSLDSRSLRALERYL
ncbi:MAG TPA: DUF1854 domain-containing protein [Isosphaeraceae bacterium]|nr:DUF1854 domain-containing protein [Isosphaeraceae bacterium]